MKKGEHNKSKEVAGRASAIIIAYTDQHQEERSRAAAAVW